MRAFLVAIISLEGLALISAGAVLLLVDLDSDRFRAETPVVAVFRPPLHGAVIGDEVRYRRIDNKTGEQIGFVDFRVKKAIEYLGTNFGRELLIEVIERDAAGRALRRRTLRWRPQDVSHGFLPPRYNEDELLPGDRPVISRISTALVEMGTRKKPRPGFLIEAVIPSRSVSKVAERYWMHQDVAIFGVTKWERREDTLVLHRQTRAAHEG